MASTWGTNTWGSNEWQDDVITVSITAPESASALGTPQSFNLEGWSRQQWGNSGWGVEYSVEPTGLSVNTSVGTVEATQTITVDLTGVSATINLGNLAISTVVETTGLAATTSLGTLEAFNERGWGRLGWGDADWNEGRDETVSISGVEATASIGSITPVFTYLLEVGPAFKMTGQVGSLGIGLGINVSGVESTFATPTLSYAGTLVGWGRDAWGDNSWGESPNQVIGLVGVAATASVGSISPADVVGISGQEATTNVGSVDFVISPTAAITGLNATVSQGTLGLEFGPAAISGVAATTNVGTLGLEFGPAEITGVSATASLGTLEVGPISLVDLTGIAATTSVGSISPADVVGISGIAATTGIGSISPADVVGLSLDQITSSVGLLGIERYTNIDTGSNTSYTSVSTGSNDTYSNVATGSNTSYSNVTTGSNDTYSDVATGSNTSYSDAA